MGARRRMNETRLPPATAACRPLDACQASPVVVPLLGRDRSDALTMTEDGVRHVAVPDLTPDGLALMLGVDVIIDPHSTPEDRTYGERSVARLLGSRRTPCERTADDGQAPVAG